MTGGVQGLPDGYRAIQATMDLASRNEEFMLLCLVWYDHGKCR